VGTSRFGYLLVLACAAAFALPGAVNAHHNGDAHQAMRIDWSFPETPTRTHSDIAMWGNTVVAGNYDGFRIFDISRQGDERLRANFLCRGPQDDVSLWEHDGRMLLFMSIDTPQLDGDTVCSPNNSSDRPASCGPPTCFEGIRIFDITNRQAPQLIRAVYTDCGSHTHTVVPDPPNNRVLLYVSSYPVSVGPRCLSPHAKISIVSVPLDAPETASVIAEPPISAPPYFGVGCHDITVFLAIHKAAASCMSEGQIWDITDPANPGTLSAVHLDVASVNFWHSAEFTWDGQYVVFDDEGTGSCSSTGNGRIWIYRVSDGALMSSFMIPRPQGVYCSVHNGNLIPVAGRYLLVAAWYGGGTSVVDFTDPANPAEIAYYDAVEGRGAANTWSSYWYNGSIYANDITRGLDVFNVIAPWTPYGLHWEHLNAQTQEELLPPPMISMTPLARVKQQRLLRKVRPGGPIRPARVAVKRLTARGPA
jgi:hypothetical protein